MPLHVDVRGSGATRSSWCTVSRRDRPPLGPLGDLLAQSHTLVAVDLPGHGDSGSVRADLPTTADLVAQAVRASVGDGPCALLGYSLGARVALHVALGPDLALSRRGGRRRDGRHRGSQEHKRRRRSDDLLANGLEASGDMEGFVDAWLRGPMFERLASTDAAGQAERLRNGEAGLASSLRLCGAGAREALSEPLPRLRCPIPHDGGIRQHHSRCTHSESPVWRRGRSPRSFPVGVTRD